MRKALIALYVVTFAATSPSSVFASGSTGAPPKPSSHQSMDRIGLNKTQTVAANAAEPVVAEEPYNLGKALFSGKYKFGNPKLSAANVAEKMQRLVTLQRKLPAAERSKLNTTALSQRLTNRELNALEYYLGTRFGKFITKAPSWAKAEPPPKVALSQ